MSRTIDVWVSPGGSDKAAGTKRQPLATPQRGLALLRKKRKALGKAGRAVEGRVLLRGGVYMLRKPLAIGPGDNGWVELDEKGCDRGPACATVITSAPGERAVLSGGKRISGWRETQVHGRRAWVARVPSAKRDRKDGGWNFSQLWVDGERVFRPRLPEAGTYRVAKRHAPTRKSVVEAAGVAMGDIFTAEDRFGYRKGEMTAAHNLQDVDFVALHFWIESRIPLKSVDRDRRIATLAYPTRMRLTDNFTKTPAPYYLDNVFEALHKPGQWYLDRSAGLLYYLPRAGQTIEETEIVAPVLDHVVSVAGDAERDRHAAHIELADLTLSHCEYHPTPDARLATPQAACHVRGAVRFQDATRCAIRRCSVEHVGSYGIEVRGDATHVTVERCAVRDTAAGGVKVFQRNRDGDARGIDQFKGAGPWFHPRHITVTDCHIHDGGHHWRQGVGVLVGNCTGVIVQHNHIHDFDYTGVSVGWTWGYQESHTAGNIIEYNHIHDIGRGVLSDMGGIYTLGKQPGTRLRYNHIHDIDSRGYGGWGIYPDEGSADMLIECNLVHDTKCDTISHHYGKNNTIRNNIFAFARSEAMVGLGRAEPHRSFTFERNIVVADGLQVVRAPYFTKSLHPHADFDHNLYFDVASKRPTFQGDSFTAWKKLGEDKHSIVADPGFKNLAKRDFTLKANSPALKIGFAPFDLSTVGPRPE